MLCNLQALVSAVLRAAHHCTAADGEQLLVMGMFVRQVSAHLAVESSKEHCAAPIRKNRRGQRSGLLWAAWIPVLGGLLAAVASARADTSITLGWDAVLVPGVTEYRVYYGTQSGQYSASVDVGLQFSCTVTGLLDNTAYYFAVTALDAMGDESSYSPEVRYPPDVPVQLSIYPDSTSLTWDEPVTEGALGYTVYYGPASGNYTNSVVAAIGQTDTGPGFTASLNSLAPGTTYYFAVSSYDAYGNASAPSDEQVYTTKIFQPPALVVASIIPEGAELFWYVLPPANTVAYVVHYGAASGDYTNSIESGSDFVAAITNLLESTTYYFAVAPIGADNTEGPLGPEQSYTVPILDTTVQGMSLPDGNDAFEITGKAGMTYQVLGSPDQQHWTILGTGTIGLDGTLQIVVPPGTLDAYPTYELAAVDAAALNPVLHISLVPEGIPVLSATGQVGHAYAVLASASLTPPAWQSVGTLYPDATGAMTFTDSAGPSRPARFYRLEDVTYAAPPPATLQITSVPLEGMVLTGTGQPNHTYNIFFTQDFVSWGLLGNAVSDDSGQFQFTDYAAIYYESRFYRAVVVPN